MAHTNRSRMWHAPGLDEFDRGGAVGIVAQLEAGLADSLDVDGGLQDGVALVRRQAHGLLGVDAFARFEDGDDPSNVAVHQGRHDDGGALLPLVEIASGDDVCIREPGHRCCGKAATVADADEGHAQAVLGVFLCAQERRGGK